MNILACDIETAPHEVWTWGLRNQDIAPIQIISPTRMLCFAAKFLPGGSESVTMQFFAEWDTSHEDVVAHAWDGLDRADVLLHYNGNAFDIPHLNREFAQAGLGPPSPYQSIDLCRVVQRKFRFASSKLEHVAPALGLKGKLTTGGFKLWRDCLDGSPAARKRMERYNKQDVRLLEELYNRVLPWIPGHPNRNLYDVVNGCPTCGSTDHMQRRGVARTRLSIYQRWHCGACGAWSRGNRRQLGVTLQEVV